MTSNIVTITCRMAIISDACYQVSDRHTVVIAPTMTIKTSAMANMTALIPPPIAEIIEPCVTNDIRPGLDKSSQK